MDMRPSHWIHLNFSSCKFRRIVRSFPATEIFAILKMFSMLHLPSFVLGLTDKSWFSVLFVAAKLFICQNFWHRFFFPIISSYSIVLLAFLLQSWCAHATFRILFIAMYCISVRWWYTCICHSLSLSRF